MMDGQNVFDQPLKNDLRTYDNIQKIEIGKGDDYKTGFSIDYTHFKDCYKLIAINLTALSGSNIKSYKKYPTVVFYLFIYLFIYFETYRKENVKFIVTN